MVTVNGVPLRNVKRKHINPIVNFDTGEGIYYVNDRKVKEPTLRDKLLWAKQELDEVQNMLANKINTLYKEIPKQGPDEYKFILSIYNRIKNVL